MEGIALVTLAVVLLLALGAGWIAHRALHRHTRWVRLGAATAATVVVVAAAVYVPSVMDIDIGQSRHYAAMSMMMDWRISPPPPPLEAAAPPPLVGSAPSAPVPMASPPSPAEAPQLRTESRRVLPRSPRRLVTPPPPAMAIPPLGGYDAAAVVRAQMQQLLPGLIEFNPPTTMRQGTREPVTVRISRHEAEDAIKQNLVGRGVVQIEQIKVGNFMAVELSGDGFQVTAKNDRNQVVPDDGFAEWRFDVLPVESGERNLDLKVSVRFKLPGESDEAADLPVFTRKIAVAVDRGWMLARFVGNNLLWILSGLGAVVAGAAGYLIRRWLERRDRQKSDVASGGAPTPAANPD